MAWTDGREYRQGTELSETKDQRRYHGVSAPLGRRYRLQCMQQGDKVDACTCELTPQTINASAADPAEQKNRQWKQNALNRFHRLVVQNMFPLPQENAKNTQCPRALRHLGFDWKWMLTALRAAASGTHFASSVRCVPISTTLGGGLCHWWFNTFSLHVIRGEVVDWELSGRNYNEFWEDPDQCPNARFRFPTGNLVSKLEHVILVLVKASGVENRGQISDIFSPINIRGKMGKMHEWIEQVQHKTSHAFARVPQFEPRLGC